MTKWNYALCLLLTLAVAIAGCGDGDSDSAGTTEQGRAGKTDASKATKDKLPKVTVVFRAESEDLGRVLFDENGVTLYFFTGDKGTKSTCYAACAKAWPPYLTRGRLKARAVIPKQLGTTKRKDGSLQVTYFGHPLYYYSGDEGGAEYNGQGVKAFGGSWYTIHPDGRKVEGSAPSTSDDSSSASAQPKKGAWGVAFGAQGEKLGIILYDLSGHTLYTFSKDKGGQSSCYGACAEKWPPALTEGKPRAGGAALAAKVGATKRKDGTRQLTYAGHPLYTFSGDRSAEVNGNGVTAFGGEWSAIRPNGQKP